MYSYFLVKINKKNIAILENYYSNITNTHKESLLNKNSINLLRKTSLKKILYFCGSIF